MVCDGVPFRAIAADLGISPKTVDAHMFGKPYGVYAKAGVDSFALLVRWAIRKGLIEA